jgi:Cys-tRNA(Pro)/Cys-tRNA(Cys) deacylase
MTPAINLLKKSKCEFTIHKYEHDPLCTDYGKEAALKLNLDANQVYKTLLCQLSSKELIVGIIPVNCTLCLKTIASYFNSKSANMADRIHAQKVTGYLLGGISPLGQKKQLRTVLDESVQNFETIFVSGGRRGLDIEVLPDDLIRLLNAHMTKITT